MAIQLIITFPPSPRFLLTIISSPKFSRLSRVMGESDISDIRHCPICCPLWTLQYILFDQSNL